MTPFENPFADYGGIVHGDRFIGRQESLKVIDSRLIQPKEPANLAIIGQPRSGKSSLVYQALIERKDQLIKDRFIPIWVNLSTYEESRAFFQSLVPVCLEELEDLDLLDTGIQRAADRAGDSQLSWNERYRKIQRFFKKVRETGYRILLILDEFDSARYLFKNSVSDFQKLRELSYAPELGITLITTSRRSIKAIELQAGDISTLSETFRRHYLAMFDAQELQVFFDRLAAAGVNACETLKSDILSYCGGYPFLLDMLGCEIIEMCQKEQEIDVEKAVTQIDQSLFGHYDHIVDLSKEDGNLDGLIQILFGPVIDVKQETVNEFLGYGLIRESDDGTYVGFSKHFHDFLRLIERKSSGGDLWPIWRDTERVLRQFISATMLEKYGERWVEQLEKQHKGIRAIFEECRNSQKTDERKFGNRASQNLIDFTYPADLFSIISSEWITFKDTFGKDKRYWNERSELLSKVRTPLAHNRDEVLQEYERQIAEGYCNEILTTLEEKIPLATRAPTKNEENQ